ncbi:MAG: FAD-binding oxidoreductase [Myxococcales bacterium]|nr:FAD-binding oxidoreductase [Myxococcales bacterium]
MPTPTLPITNEKDLTNWGNFPRADAQVVTPRRLDELPAALASGGPLIGRGLGRSYGDASLAAKVVQMTQLNRFVAFDAQAGTITCEAGCSLAEVLDHVVPRGFFLPVTPGTKFVTVGGAIAADVHGKNHHKDGSFGDHVLWLELLRADGRTVRCSPNAEPALFEATLGGMGLTGLVTQACFRLKPIESAYIRQTRKRAANLEAIFRLFEENTQTTYSMAWIDCLAGGSRLGRSVLFLGEHATLSELPRSLQSRPLAARGGLKLDVPLFLPNKLLNGWSVRLFNEALFRTWRDKRMTLHYDPFFYPLDKIHHWNRIYGRRGFVQYQPVLPLEQSYDGMVEILEAIARFNQGSFLAVLKLFGDQRRGISFPMRGYTLALDFPVSESLFRFLDTLDEIVVRRGGRIYLAKDGRMKAKTFAAGYPTLASFREVRDEADPTRLFGSQLSQRLSI